MARGYVNIGVPKNLADAIDAVIRETAFGYTSKGEVVKHALREYLLGLVKADVLPASAVKRKGE